MGEDPLRIKSSFRSEFHVTVVGVSKLEVTEYHLSYGEFGFIELEVSLSF